MANCTNSDSSEALQPKSSLRSQGLETPEAATDHSCPKGREGMGDSLTLSSRVSMGILPKPRPGSERCLPVQPSEPASHSPGLLSPGGSGKTQVTSPIPGCLIRQVWGKERACAFLSWAWWLGDTCRRAAGDARPSVLTAREHHRGVNGSTDPCSRSQVSRVPEDEAQALACCPGPGLAKFGVNGPTLPRSSNVHSDPSSSGSFL